MKGSHPGYERDEILNTYLLFHYGSNQDQLPFSFGPQNSLHFPVRCVTECVDLKALPANAAAIDLGCAVGRSSFELARHCKRVLGIDSSHLFIETAKQLQTKGEGGISRDGRGHAEQHAQSGQTSKCGCGSYRIQMLRCFGDFRRDCSI